MVGVVGEEVLYRHGGIHSCICIISKGSKPATEVLLINKGYKSQLKENIPPHRFSTLLAEEKIDFGLYDHNVAVMCRNLQVKNCVELYQVLT